MLHINRLRIKLPAGMGHRAVDIAREFGRGLAEAKIDNLTCTEKSHIAVRDVSIGPGDNNRDVVRKMIQAVTKELGCER